MTQLPSSLNPALFPIPPKQQKTAKPKISATSLAPILHSPETAPCKASKLPKSLGTGLGESPSKRNFLGKRTKR